ncbi:TIGR02444 family protein (plasmid) [Sinorhizobium meliloti]|nr:TIGR02444 family protein [Sinorhizobium meliloti]
MTKPAANGGPRSYVPLRAVRVQLKANPWKENHEAVVAFREKIKALELEAEKLEVSVLEKAIIALARTENHVDKPARIAAVAHMVLSHFAADNLTGELPQASLIVDAVRSLLRR